MTLIPVSNMSGPGLELVEGRGVAVDLPVVLDAPIESVSSGLPSTLKTWPEHGVAHGDRDAPPEVAHRRRRGRGRRSAACRCSGPGRRRSAGPPRPMIVFVSPSSSMSNSTAWLISGSAWGGNSTSMTGPAMATTRPSSSEPAGAVSCVTEVVVIDGRCSLRLAERLGAADDFHDLGGDGVLTGAVHDSGQGADQLVRVVGRGRHGPLLGGEERRPSPRAGRRRSRSPRPGAPVGEQRLAASGSNSV